MKFPQFWLASVSSLDPQLSLLDVAHPKRLGWISKSETQNVSSFTIGAGIRAGNFSGAGILLSLINQSTIGTVTGLSLLIMGES